MKIILTNKAQAILLVSRLLHLAKGFDFTVTALQGQYSFEIPHCLPQWLLPLGVLDGIDYQEAA